MKKQCAKIHVAKNKKAVIVDESKGVYSYILNKVKLEAIIEFKCN